MTNWLINFKGRNDSGRENINFLWRHDNIYIMDNHRVALWCWLEYLKTKKKLNFIHIDRHADMFGCSDDFLKSCPDLNSITLEDYLNAKWKPKYSNEPDPIFTFENFISIFLRKYQDKINCFQFVIPNDVQRHYVKVDTQNCSSVEPTFYCSTAIQNNLSHYLEDTPGDWICDIDLDFFFYEDNQGECHFLFSEKYIVDLFSNIKKCLNSKIAVLTIALSPECCGGWKNAEKICAIATSVLEIDFSLP